VGSYQALKKMVSQQLTKNRNQGAIKKLNSIDKDCLAAIALNGSWRTDK
jgi:hypothetical protein